MKRAVITGLGIVSSIGNNQQEVLLYRPIRYRRHNRHVHSTTFCTDVKRFF